MRAISGVPRLIGAAESENIEKSPAEFQRIARKQPG
jgi:hypothetical protein